MPIVSRIKMLAEQQGLTLKSLETECGLGNGTISKWDSKKGPSLSNIERVAEVLGVSIDFLAHGNVSSVNKGEKYDTLSEPELNLLMMFRKLDQRDQEDLMGIARMKLQHSSQLLTERSSTSSNGEENTGGKRIRAGS